MFVALVAPPALVCGGALVARLAFRARERRRHERIVEGLSVPVAEDAVTAVPPRTTVTLEGVVTSASPRVVSFHPYGTSFLDEANVYAVTHLPEGTLTIELARGRAVVEGDVQVVVGSSETEHDAPLAHAGALGAEPIASASVRRRAGQFRSIGPGDRVRVRGVVTPAPDDEAFYRDGSKTVRVAPEPCTEPGRPVAVPIAAMATVQRRVQPRRPLRWALVASLALGVTSAAALSKLPAKEAARPVATTTSSRPAPACRAPVVEAIERTDPRAAELAAQCDDPFARALASFAGGDFAMASDLFRVAREAAPELAPSLSEAEAHLFVHDYENAALVVHRMLDVFYPGPETSEKRYLDCIASVFDARAAEARGGKGPYVPKGTGRYRTICSKRPFAKIARELDAEGAYWGDDDWLDFGHYRPEVKYDGIAAPATAAVATRGRLLFRPVALEKSLLDRLVLAPGPGRPGGGRSDLGRTDLFFGSERDTYALMTAFAADLTLFYAYAGFPERSKPYWPYLDRAAAALEKEGQPFHEIAEPFEWDADRVDEERTRLSYVLGVAAAAALHSGDAARAERYTKVAEVHSGHVVRQLRAALTPGTRWEEPAEDGHWPDHAAVFEAGLTGDAEAVVTTLVAQKSSGRDTLPRILPRLTKNRPALQTWFTTRFASTCVTCGGFQWLGQISDRREVARLLGDGDGERAQLASAAKSFTDALTDPAIAFELDELETFFGTKR